MAFPYIWTDHYHYQLLLYFLYFLHIASPITTYQQHIGPAHCTIAQSNCVDPNHPLWPCCWRMSSTLWTYRLWECLSTHNGSQYLEILVLNTQLRNIPNSQRKKKSNNYNNLGPFNIIFGSLNFEPKLHPNKTTCFYQLECRRLYPLSFSICFSKMSLIKKLYSLVDGSIKITHPPVRSPMRSASFTYK